MKIDTNEDGEFVIKEVYSGLTLETGEGNRLCICMRDDTFEMTLAPKGSLKYSNWRVNMQTGVIEERKGES